MATREAIMDALLARAADRCGAIFGTYSRRFQMYDDLVRALTNNTAPKFPAFYLYDGVGFGGGRDTWDQSAQRSIANDAKRTMTRTIVLYALKPKASTPDGADISVAGASELHPLIEAVEGIFDVDNFSYNTLTLGGLCRHCWIEGDGILIPGDIDESGLAMQTIPVKILIP